MLIITKNKLDTYKIHKEQDNQNLRESVYYFPTVMNIIQNCNSVLIKF